LNFLGQNKEASTDYYLCDVPFSQTLSSSLVIPHVAQNTIWDTTVFIANPNTSTATTTLTYTNKNGTTSRPYITTVLANGSKEISVSTIANSNSIEGGCVEISSTQGLTSFALYDNLKSGNFSFAGIKAVDISVSATESKYYMPLFKPQPGYWSGLGIANLSNTNTANVVVTVYDQNGVVLTTETTTLIAHGQDAFLVGSNLSSEGWIKVVSDQPLAGLNFLGQNKGSSTDYFLGDVPFTQTLSSSLLIPHVAQSTTWDTTVFVANPNTSTATVTLTYTDKDGSASAPYSMSIPANGSKEISADTIANSVSVEGGQVSISSDYGLTAFALYNNLKIDNFSYAGINAVDISK